VKVLIADDDAGFRELAKVVIADAWPDAELVGEAADGTEAVSVAIATRPDLVILDFAMPGLDGGAAALVIRRALPRVRILMVSGTDRSEDAAKSAVVKLLRKDVLTADTLREAFG
jgi:DNA-binding NarL/FixJ family response regulator